MKKLLFGIFAIIAVLFAVHGCTKKPQVNPVAIIGMDAMDWQIVRDLVKEGKMPNVQKFIEKGVFSEMATLEPILSPAIWTTIATGVTPEKHGITWFLVKDANDQMMPVTSAQRRVKALWNIASENKRDVDVIGWWATWPAEKVRGNIISDHMGFHIFAIQSDKVDTNIGNTYPESIFKDLAPLQVEEFKIPLNEIKRYMGISDLEYNVSIDMKALCSRPEYKDCLYCKGESTVPFCHFNPLHHFLRALTTLEGFNKMSQYLLKKHQPDLFMVYYEWVDVVGHQYTKFMPPKMDWVTDEQYEKYKNVIRQTYIRQDEVLGETIAAMSPNTNIMIMSDHGFKIGDERLVEEKVTQVAKAHLWHRQPAFLAMLGPDIRKGGKEIKARVQDIAPTVLALMALPVADDMDGGVLKDAVEPAFLQRHPIRRIPTYEKQGKKNQEAASESGKAAGSNIDPEIKEKLKAMGYIGDVDDTGLEVGRVKILIDKKQFKEAAEIADAIYQKDPKNLKVISMLGDLYFQMKNFPKAIDVFSSIDKIPENEIPEQGAPAINLILANWGIALMNMGSLDAAEEKCKKSVGRDPNNFMAQFCLGRVAEVQQKIEIAIGYYKESVRLNPMAAEAQNNLGNCYFRQEKYKEAIVQYTKAAEANPNHVESHHNAGIAYTKLKKFDKAEEEFNAALKLNPQLVPSMMELGSLKMEQKKYEEAAETYLKINQVQQSNPAPYYFAARAKILAGKRDEAIELLKKAKSLNPGVTKRITSDPLFKSINPEELK